MSQLCQTMSAKVPLHNYDYVIPEPGTTDWHLAKWHMSHEGVPQREVALRSVTGRYGTAGNAISLCGTSTLAGNSATSSSLRKIDPVPGSVWMVIKIHVV